MRLFFSRRLAHDPAMSRQTNPAARVVRYSPAHASVPIGRRRRYYLAPVEDALVMRVDIGAHCAPGPAGPAELAGPVGPVGAEAVDADLRGGRMRRRGPGD